jgi:coniferyl-aldehyde dehydrogenase
VTKPESSDSGSPDPSVLRRLFDLQRTAFAGERFPELATRRDRVSRVLAITRDHEAAIVDAIEQDFGHRSGHETRLAELFVVATSARSAGKELPRWMRTRRVATPMHLRPGRAELRPQPLGVVGIISPWNYPCQLALVPALGALAAGNRVVVKPSELTPAFAALLQRLVGQYFREDEFAVVPGDVAVGRAFAGLPWDHLLFTGSTAVGRQVALAAAANLTPVTLELGGKSPALFAPDADLALTVPRLVAGKLLNAGQTCIAPDYALVPAAQRDDWVAAVRAAVSRLYPTLGANPDYTAIVHERHYERLRRLIADARERGAEVIELNPAGERLDPAGRRLAPTLILGATDAMAVMQEEIFGPVLPVLTYTSLDHAVARINAGPRPLAFYYFGADPRSRDQVLRETHAGGVTVNDTLWHCVHEGLPFGGVGASGLGAYHGEHSFRRFSLEKPVFHQSRWSTARFLWPPYRQRFDQILALIRRFAG